MPSHRQGRTGSADTRSRILQSSADLFRRDGYEATGLKRISAAAEAPFGSIYHFFPGGKQELAEHAIRRAGDAYGRLVLGLLDNEDDPLKAIEAAFTKAAADLEASDYADACPIATVALEVASSNETLRVAAADVFGDWVEAGTAWFRRHGIDDGARPLAQSLIMLLEGAFLLGRTQRSREPMLTAGRAVVALTRAALPPASR